MSQFAFLGEGNFSTEQGFDTIRLLDASSISYFDTTGALELLLDVDTFNKKIGIFKDIHNIALDFSETTTKLDFYDSSSDKLKIDELTISAEELIAGINNSVNNVLTVGKLKTLYSDFGDYVASYFAFPSGVNDNTSLGFATLFSGDYDFNANNGVFGAAELLTTMTSESENTSENPTDLGVFRNNLVGSITLSDITALLRTAVLTNSFKNRSTQHGKTAGDVNDPANYGVSDGFIDGDLLFIPSNGYEISLNLGILSSSFPVNDGTEYSESTANAQDALMNANTIDYSSEEAVTTRTTFSSVSSSTDSLITRKVSVPLLIRMTNLKLPYISVLQQSTASIEKGEFLIRGLFDTLYVDRKQISGGNIVEMNVNEIESLPIIVDDEGNSSYLFTDNTIIENELYEYSFTPRLGSNINDGYPYVIENKI